MTHAVRKWLCAILFTLSLVAAALPKAMCQRDAQDESVASVARILGDLKFEQSPQARLDLAKELVMLVQRIDPSDFEASMIDEFAGLLGDREEWVRASAATCLGYIGPPASRAIPQLEQALAKEMPNAGVVPETGPAASMFVALMLIRRPPNGSEGGEPSRSPGP